MADTTAAASARKEALLWLHASQEGINISAGTAEPGGLPSMGSHRVGND